MHSESGVPRTLNCTLFFWLVGRTRRSKKLVEASERAGYFVFPKKVSLACTRQCIYCDIPCLSKRRDYRLKADYRQTVRRAPRNKRRETSSRIIRFTYVLIFAASKVGPSQIELRRSYSTRVPEIFAYRLSVATSREFPIHSGPYSKSHRRLTSNPRHLRSSRQNINPPLLPHL